MPHPTHYDPDAYAEHLIRLCKQGVSVEGVEAAAAAYSPEVDAPSAEVCARYASTKDADALAAARHLATCDRAASHPEHADAWRAMHRDDVAEADRARADLVALLLAGGQSTPDPDRCARCGGIEPYEVDDDTPAETMVCACYEDSEVSLQPVARWREMIAANERRAASPLFPSSQAAALDRRLAAAETYDDGYAR